MVTASSHKNFPLWKTNKKMLDSPLTEKELVLRQNRDVYYMIAALHVVQRNAPLFANEERIRFQTSTVGETT